MSHLTRFPPHVATIPSSRDPSLIRSRSFLISPFRSTHTISSNVRRSSSSSSGSITILSAAGDGSTTGRDAAGPSGAGNTDGKAKRRGFRPLLLLQEAVARRFTAMFYGAMVWDPWLILAQIASLQALFYLSLGSCLWLTVGTHVPRFTLKYFFDYSVVSVTSFVGWCCILALLMNAVAGAFFLLLIVERTKKCLDFAATVHIVHAFLCLVFAGPPSSLSWWFTTACCCALMTLLGEWLCMRREQREIPLTSGGGGGGASRQ